MKNDILDVAFVIRVLTKEVSEKDRLKFYADLESNDAKKQAFEEIKMEWVLANDAMLHKSLDVEGAWQIQKDRCVNLKRKQKTVDLGQILKWAAVLVVGFGLSFYMLEETLFRPDSFTSYTTGPKETLPVILKDGSLITLNQNSKIEYDLSDDNRAVYFEGEAFFEIQSNPEKPFLVKMSNSYVKVYGTSFNISNESSTMVKVFVEEGLVELGQANVENKILLTAGSSGTFSDGEILKFKEKDLNVTSWLTKELVFEETPLVEVFSSLSNTFYADFKFDNNSLMQCQLTANFKDEELDDILETITTIFELNIEPVESTYRVSGKPCEVN